MSNVQRLTSPETSSHSPHLNDEAVDVKPSSLQQCYSASPSVLWHYGIPRMPPPVVAPPLIFGTSVTGAVVSDRLPVPAMVPIRGTQSIGSYTQETLPAISCPNSASFQSELDREASQGCSSVKARMHWCPWQVEALIEAKKIEWNEQRRGRVVSADVRWRRVQDFMRERGIPADVSQLRNKWESVLCSWKSVREWNNKSGNPSFLSMSRYERRDAKLPLEFPQKWFELLASFHGQLPSMQAPCMADSSIIGNPNTPDATDVVSIQAEDDNPSKAAQSGAAGATGRSYSDDATVEVPIQAEDDHPSTAAQRGADAATARSNSGKKRKDLSSSGSSLADCLSALGDTMLDIENRKLEFEMRRLKWSQSVEERRISSANEGSAQLCSVLSLMARALERIADSFPVRAPNYMPPFH